MYKFAPADRHELNVFGASRPKYAYKSVRRWIEFMRQQGIEGTCCLLSSARLNRYPDNLLETYRQEFSEEHVLWQPIKDFQIPKSEILTEAIFPFLIHAVENQRKVVVHCSGGIGRTGIVLAGWLVNQRGLTNRQAICAVKQNKRYPQEAIIAALFKGQNPCLAKQELDYLLNRCRSVAQ